MKFKQSHLKAQKTLNKTTREVQYQRQKLAKLTEYIFNQDHHSFPLNLIRKPKYAEKYLKAQIVGFDEERLAAIRFMTENLIKIEYRVTECQFNEAISAVYQNIMISRLLLDYTQLINMLFLFANLLFRLELRERYVFVLKFIADFCVATYNLQPLMNAYLQIAK